MLLLSTAIPALCALSIESEESGSVNEHDQLEEYVHQLSMICESQVEEIAASISPDDVERLRNEHYTWKLQRNLHCQDVARNSADELGELRCLAESTGEYFDRREAEIGNIEASQAHDSVKK